TRLNDEKLTWYAVLSGTRTSKYASPSAGTVPATGRVTPCVSWPDASSMPIHSSTPVAGRPVSSYTRPVIRDCPWPSRVAVHVTWKYWSPSDPPGTGTAPDPSTSMSQSPLTAPVEGALIGAALASPPPNAGPIAIRPATTIAKMRSMTPSFSIARRSPNGSGRWTSYEAGGARVWSPEAASPRLDTSAGSGRCAAGTHTGPTTVGAAGADCPAADTTRVTTSSPSASS